MMMRKIVLMLTLLSLSTNSFGDVEVDVPVDELAQESVYPVFDQSKSVKNRNVATRGRIDVGVFGGMALTEPIASTNKFGVAANYHFSEYHSLGFLFAANNSASLSRDAEGLKQDFGLDFSRAPQPQNTMLLDYNYKPFYGKLSLTKDGVINTTIYGSAAVGMVKYEHKSYPALGLGIGERFYFNKGLSLKVDLRLMAHQAPIPFKRGSMCDGSKPSCGLNGASGDPVPAKDSFSERITYTTNLEIGLNYLF